MACTSGPAFERNPDWGKAVERWNALQPHERAVRVFSCKQQGHDWIRVAAMNAHLCARCCKWSAD